MLISCIQLNPQTNVHDNLTEALKQISHAAEKGAEVVVLPEMFSYMGDESRYTNIKSPLNDGLFAELKNAARTLKINLVAGTHAEAIENEKRVYNTCVTYNKQGNTVSTYRKAHLFNLRDEQGKPLYCETNIFKSGEFPKAYALESLKEKWNCLNIICYDLRFPEIIRINNSSPFDIIFVPAAFTWQTGKDHWEVLLRARAIENLCYVVACNQTGYHTNGEKRTYGHSMIIDPWGNIMAQSQEECVIVSAEVSKKCISEARLKLPALRDRIYK